MNITSAQYLSDEITVSAVIDGVLMNVPVTPDNRHYAEILRQVDAGTITIEDAD